MTAHDVYAQAKFILVPTGSAQMITCRVKFDATSGVIK